MPAEAEYLAMVTFREPASIAFHRRDGGGDPVLEPLVSRRTVGTREFIVVCGMGGNVVFIRWYAKSVDDARQSFREWLAQPWQTLSTDFAGAGLPNGLDFKPGKIEWFTISD